MSEDRRSPSGPIATIVTTGTLFVPAFAPGALGGAPMTVLGAQIGDLVSLSVVASAGDIAVYNAVVSGPDTVSPLFWTATGYPGGNVVCGVVLSRP